MSAVTVEEPECPPNTISEDGSHCEGIRVPAVHKSWWQGSLWRKQSESHSCFKSDFLTSRAESSIIFRVPKVLLQLFSKGREIYLLQLNKSILRQPSFAKFWFSRILASTSFQMLSVAIGWQMYDLTHDAFSLGLVGLAQFIPMVLLTLVVGQVADRFDRRKIVFWCLLIEGMMAGLLLYGNHAGWLGRE